MMVFDYTKTEMQRLMEMECYYEERLDDLNAELMEHREGSKAYQDVVAKYYEMIDQRISDFSALYDEFERKRFEQLRGDPAAILEDGKKQIEKIIETTFKQRAEYDLVKDETGDLKPRTDNPRIESTEAIVIIKRGIRPHMDALQEDKQRAKELRDYMYEYLSRSRYIYTDAHKKDAAEISPDAEIAEIMRSPLPPIRTYGLLNDKVNKSLISGNMVAQETDGQLRLILGANQAPKGRKEVPVYVAMRYEGEDIRIARRITAFDAAVYNAVSTLYYYHGRSGETAPLYITPQDVWRTMNGIKDSRKAPTDKQSAAVCKSMDKMRFTNFFMDISAEIKAHYITFKDERITEGRIETYLLKSEKVTFKTEKGKEVTGYRIDNEPILYSYNAAKNHVMFVDYDLLDTSDQTGNEGYTVEFRSYLLQQIELMINGTRNNTLIKYETIYKETAIPAPAERVNRQDYTNDHSYKNTVYREVQKDRQKIAALLDSWIAKDWIKGYEPAPAKKGRGTIGVEIKLYAEKEKPKKKRIETK